MGTIAGIPTIKQVITNYDHSTKRYTFYIEGSDLLSVIGTQGILGTRTTSNHIIEVAKILGIEAARTTIVNEVTYVMTSYGIFIDTRHVMLLTDYMSSKGEILGITRFGIAKTKTSTLMLASFESTAEHLFNAAVCGKTDKIEGISECIIMGVPIQTGTGLFHLFHSQNNLSS